VFNHNLISLSVLSLSVSTAASSLITGFRVTPSSIRTSPVFLPLLLLLLTVVLRKSAFPCFLLVDSLGCSYMPIRLFYIVLVLPILGLHFDSLVRKFLRVVGGL